VCGTNLDGPRCPCSTAIPRAIVSGHLFVPLWEHHFFGVRIARKDRGGISRDDIVLSSGGVAGLLELEIEDRKYQGDEEER